MATSSVDPKPRAASPGPATAETDAAEAGVPEAGVPEAMAADAERTDAAQPACDAEPADVGASVADGADSERGGTEPTASTRERILDIALALFNEQGYEKTSLREIAERLGTTKAALYYHFARKEDILLELHLRLHALGREALDELGRLDDDPARAEAWPALLDRFIDQVMSNPELFLLHQRNRGALEGIRDERHDAENDDMQAHMQALLGSPDIPLAQRVRMACSVGAVMTVLMVPSEVFGQPFGGASIAELGELVREAMRDLLRLD